MLCPAPLGVVLLPLQMLGRGLRIMPGKSDCLVLDFTDNDHEVKSLGTT